MIVDAQGFNYKGILNEMRSLCSAQFSGLFQTHSPFQNNTKQLAQTHFERGEEEIDRSVNTERTKDRFMDRNTLFDSLVAWVSLVRKHFKLTGQ